MIRHKEAKALADISAVIDLLIEYNPIMATANFSTIHMWVNQGCDVNLDIIPTLKKVMQQNRKITSTNYFTNAVCGQRDKRVALAKMEEPKHGIEYYMGIYKWKRDKGLPLKEAEIKSLEEYERGLAKWV